LDGDEKPISNSMNNIFEYRIPEVPKSRNLPSVAESRYFQTNHIVIEQVFVHQFLEILQIV
jgi:hypothetical protein